MKRSSITSSKAKRVGIYSSIALAASAGTLLAVRARAAGIPDAAALTYTGYLESPDGTPVTSTKGIGVALYAAESGGKEVCGVKPADITPTSGRFQITLPEDCTDAVKANPDLWVEVEVEGSLLGRTKLGAVPYAIEAGHAAAADAAMEATHATNADVANKAAGALKVTIDGLGDDVAQLASFPIHYKGGNNGTQTCQAFCLNPSFSPVGLCMGAREENTGAYLTCDQKPTTGNLLCWCATP